MFQKHLSRVTSWLSSMRYLKLYIKYIFLRVIAWFFLSNKELKEEAKRYNIDL